MIYIGDKKLKRCYLGDKKIGTVYLGDEVLYQHISRLPEGYKEVEYIANPNYGYIASMGLTGTNPFSGVKIGLTVKLNSTSSSSNIYYIFGAACNYRANTSQSYTGREHNFSLGSSGKLQVFTTTTSIAPNLGDIWHVELDYVAKTLMVNDSDPASFTFSTAMAKSVTPALFCRHVRNYTYNTLNGDTYYQPCDYNLYSFKMSKNDEVIKEWIPCIDPNGNVGLYDLVTETFSKSALDAKPFVAGPVV